MRTFTLILISFCFFSNAIAQPIADRLIQPQSDQGYVAGVPIYVSITITGITEDVIIQEIPPAGWDISDVYPSAGSYAGKVSDGVITWNYPKSRSTPVIQYIVIPPENVTGDAMFTGKIGDSDIIGDAILIQHIPEPLGIFQDHIDFGRVLPGDAFYDNRTDEYIVSGSGREPYNPACHCVYRKISGSFSIKAKMYVWMEQNLRWGANIIILDDLSENSLYYTIFVSSGGEAVVAAGSFTGAHYWSGDSSIFSGDISSDIQDGEMKIVREEDSLSAYYFNTKTHEWELHNRRTLNFTDPVYVAISGYSALYGAYATATYSDVELISLNSSTTDWELHR